MADKRPNIFAHGSYVGTTGYSNHTRNFFRALSDYFLIKVRNFTIGAGWDGDTKTKPIENQLKELNSWISENKVLYYNNI